MIILEKVADLPVAAAHYEPEEKLWRVIVEPKGLFNCWDGAKKNFLYENGTPVSHEYFEFLSGFHSGWGIVGKRNKAGECIFNFINRDGLYISDNWYWGAEDFQGGVALVAIGESAKDCRQKLIGLTGTVLEWFTKCGYRIFQYPVEGMMAVSIERPEKYVTEHDELGNWGFVALDGTILVKPQFAAARSFKNGYAEVCRDNGKGDYFWGLIDRNGNEIIPCLFTEIHRLQDQGNPWYRVEINHEKRGILSDKNEWIVKPLWGDIGYWMEADQYIEVGLRDFWKDTSTENLNGLLRISDEKLLVPMEYTTIDFIREGLYKVCRACDEPTGSPEWHYEDWLIDGENKNAIQGKRFGSLSVSEGLPYIARDLATGKDGLMDERGNMIVECKYHIPWDGINRKKKWFVHDNGNQVSVFDFQEKVILPPKFNWARFGERDLIEVAFGDRDKEGKFDWQRGKFGLLDLEFKEVLPPVFSQLSFANDLIIAKDDRLCSVFRITKDVVRE